jgi:hypothetical protein
MSAEIIEGGAEEPEVPQPEAAPVHDRDDLQDVFTGGYFNIDAQRHLAHRLAPGRYDVTLSYAGFRSDPVSFGIETASKRGDTN